MLWHGTGRLAWGILAWHSTDSSGTEMAGTARHGMYSTTSAGTARTAMARFAMARHGMEMHGAARALAQHEPCSSLPDPNLGPGPQIASCLSDCLRLPYGNLMVTKGPQIRLGIQLAPQIRFARLQLKHGVLNKINCG